MYYNYKTTISIVFMYIFRTIYMHYAYGQCDSKQLAVE